MRPSRKSSSRSVWSGVRKRRPSRSRAKMPRFSVIKMRRTETVNSSSMGGKLANNDINLRLMSKVKVGLVQMSCTADKAANLQKAVEKIREAAGKGAQIVCLQELFTSLYFCDVEDYDNFKLAESIPGPSTDMLSKVAAEHSIVIIASLFEKRAQGIYHNTTAVLDADGSYLGKYRKMHIPDDPSYYEKFYFT